jgi:hypothetical protein
VRSTFPHPLLRICACVALVWACGHQSEGERCDLNNGNLDCADGLECRSGAQLSSAFNSKGIALCCPVGDVSTTVDACRAGAQLPPDQNFVAPPDAGTASAPAAP